MQNRNYFEGLKDRHLTEADVIRHYDITRKTCPKRFIDNEEAWRRFKRDVKSLL